MGKYIGKRVLIAILTLLGISFVVFILSYMAPGSPIDMVINLSSNSTSGIEAEVARLEEAYGLDQPILVQYWGWLKQIVQGNFGTSYRTSRPVLEMILERLGPTLLLMCTSMGLAIVIGVFMGTLAAHKPYSGWDITSSGLSYFGSAMPSFFMAIMLIFLFSVKVQLFPSSGMYNSEGTQSFGDLLYHMFLPCVTLALANLGMFARQTRSSMLETIASDYVRTARAKGLHEGRVMVRHAMRNSLIPVVAQISMILPSIVGGAIVTEQVFSWPGLGMLMVQSVTARDYPAIMGITVFIAITVLVGNMLIDIAYSFLDPRIRHS